MKAIESLVLVACVANSFIAEVSHAQSKPVITRGNVQSLSVEQLKRLGWPEGDAPVIMDSRVVTEGNMWPPGSTPRVELIEFPSQIDSRICRRITYELPLKWQDPIYLASADGNLNWTLNDTSILLLRGAPQANVGITIGPKCMPDTARQFARVSADFEPTAITALRLLDNAFRHASKIGRLGFSVECRIKSGPNRCGRNGPTSFSQLPIQQVWNIQTGSVPNSFEYWVGTPGQLVWDVTLTYGAEGKPLSVVMESKIPNPF